MAADANVMTASFRVSSPVAARTTAVSNMLGTDTAAQKSIFAVSTLLAENGIVLRLIAIYPSRLMLVEQNVFVSEP